MHQSVKWLNQPIFLSFLTGEKMNEAEIDALMQGQEDENGCVNYEGQLKYFLTEHFVTTVKKNEWLTIYRDNVCVVL